jgi:hypothetical protein
VTKRNLLLATLLIAIFGLLGTPATAQGKGNGHGKAKEQHGQSMSKHEEHANNKMERRSAWERHDKYEVRTYREHDGMPPGWSRGKKVGWGDCGVPPGHAKKGECRSYIYEGRRYYYYRTSLGHIVVRRPIVNISIY